MAELPSGTVTFLFTDVEGSTRLLDELGAERYAAELAGHRQIVRDALARAGGVEVDTQGDAFFCAFSRAADAVEAAAAAQRALATGAVRVRMGLHTGEPLLAEGGYIGSDVHRAARIAALGHGGQVLVSQTTRDLVPSAVVRDLGEHVLKDFARPERIWQLGDDEHPPLHSARRSNLPIPTSPFVGRGRELRELVELVREARLVTVTGTVGSGKTRLAVEVARSLHDELRDGVLFVPLARIDVPELVLPAIVEAAGVRMVDDLPRLATLVVLDNFEQLLEAASAIGALLAESPDLTILATSVAPLRIAAEREYPLEPLERDDALELLRVRAAAAGTRLEPDSVADAICARLDDLPLALELGAARLHSLDPATLLERLDRRLALLTRGARDAPERQRTLRAAISWSVDLLDEDGRALFARLGVFSGSFSLEAVQAVCGASLDDVDALVDVSLLKSQAGGRFLMLETIRELAHEELERDPDAEELRRRHTTFYAELVEAADRQLTGPDQEMWFARLRSEHDNIRAALAWACDRGQTTLALRLAGNLARFWWSHGHSVEGARWLERALALPDPKPELRARGLYAAGAIGLSAGDNPQARRHLEEALPLIRDVGDELLEVHALNDLANTYAVSGDLEAADRIFAEGTAVARRLGDLHGVALTTLGRARSAIERGDDRAAASLLDEGKAAAAACGDRYCAAAAESCSSVLALRRGDVVGATRAIRASIETNRSQGDVLALAHSLALASSVAAARGRFLEAARAAHAAVSYCRTTGVMLDHLEGDLADDALAAARRELGAAVLDRQSDDLAEAVDAVLAALQIE